MKKILSILLVFILLFSAVPISASQEIDPLQKFFVYSLSLDEESRIAVVDTLKTISQIAEATPEKTSVAVT